MVGHEVFLQFAGTSPHESAEWTLLREHVHILHMSSEFLVSPEGFVTIHTGMARPAGAASGTIDPVPQRALGSEIPPDSLELSLGV